MKIVLVAATDFEISSTIKLLEASPSELNKHEIQILITGVGLVNTTFALMNYLKNHQPALLIQAGIGGSFDINYPLASTWLIDKEYLGDLGVEENNHYFDMFEKGFLNANHPPFIEKSLPNIHIEKFKYTDLNLATAISVNEITTRQMRIQQLKNKYQPAIESMEGAAFHYVALQNNIPFLQIRSVSNFVGERNKENWKLKEAILHLNNNIIKLLRTI